MLRQSRVAREGLACVKTSSGFPCSLLGARCCNFYELLSEEFVLSCISQGWQEIQYVFTDGVVFRMSGQTTNSILSLSDFRILLDSYNIEFMEFIDLPIIENYVL